MSGNKKDTKTNVSNTTKKNEEEENAELVRITIVIFSSWNVYRYSKRRLNLKCLYPAIITKEIVRILT